MRFTLQKTFDGTPAQNSNIVAVAAFGIIAGVCVLVAVLIWFIERGISAEARLLAAEAVEAPAVVLDRRMVESRNTDKDGHTTTSMSYYLRLEFVTAAGDRVEIEPSVGQERYDASPAGTTLTLRYAPSDPRVVEFEAGERAAEAGVLQWIWKSAGGLAAVFAVLALWKTRRPVNVV